MRAATRSLIGLIVSGSLSAPLTAQTDEIASQRARWDANDVASYRYAYQKYCDCHRSEPPHTFVIVEDDTITRVYHVHANSEREVPAREGSLDLYWTIDDLFELVSSASTGAASTRIRFHEELGYPVSIYIDYETSTVGEELDLRLTMLELLE